MILFRKPVYLLIVLVLFTTTTCRRKLPTPPPLPVQPLPPVAAPVVSLAADRTVVEAGETVTLEWKSNNATTVRISQIGNVPVNGRARVTPQGPRTYTATAAGPGGTASDTVHIAIKPAEREPEKPTEPASPGSNLDEDFRLNIHDVYFE